MSKSRSGTKEALSLWGIVSIASGFVSEPLNTGCWGWYHSSLSSTMDLSLELYKCICVPLDHVISNGSFVYFSNRLTSHRNLFWKVRNWLPPGMNQSIAAINNINQLNSLPVTARSLLSSDNLLPCLNKDYLYVCLINVWSLLIKRMEQLGCDTFAYNHQLDLVRQPWAIWPCWKQLWQSWAFLITWTHPSKVFLSKFRHFIKMWFLLNKHEFPIEMPLCLALFAWRSFMDVKLRMVIQVKDGSL